MKDNPTFTANTGCWLTLVPGKATEDSLVLKEYKFPVFFISAYLVTSSGFIPRLTANLEAGPHLVPELNLTFLINLSSGISGLTCGDTSSGSFVTDREDFVLGVNQVPNLQPILRCDRSTRLLDSLLDSFWELANPVVGEVVSSIPGFLLVFYQLLICLPNLQVALLVTRSSLLLNCGSDRIGYEFRIF